MIERCIPGEEYERVMDLYDEMSDDNESESALLLPWYARACAMDSRWKLEMVGKLLYVAAGGRTLTVQAIAEVAVLVEQIGALPEFHALLFMEVETDAGVDQCKQLRYDDQRSYKLQTGFAGV
jgi:hypothetical protein